MQGSTLSDIDPVPRALVNEAFAQGGPGLGAGTGADLGKTNVNGGAIAIEHPLGASRAAS